MADLRKQLAAFQEEAAKILDAVGDREWPLGKVRTSVNLLSGDLDEVISEISYLIGQEEAWEEEE